MVRLGEFVEITQTTIWPIQMQQKSRNFLFGPFWWRIKVLCYHQYGRNVALDTVGFCFGLKFALVVQQCSRTHRSLLLMSQCNENQARRR
jgi:hypothetical protein